ncbi:uncharacterized protein LOC111643549 [Copidosoma floridanum]|uniref:uncharacterized protein LOC111643549 n=1 Tax=Copidosoma floridanum TaxID=29053 RepID=UPI000C6F78F0|nr:uncharacterized protein LOC111643549 [Copidosoma floridanum]
MPTHIEIIDKTSGENNQMQMVKYQNSYRLDSKNVFRPDTVAKLVEAIMTENFENFTYNYKESVKMSVDTAAEIRKKIQTLQFDRRQYHGHMVPTSNFGREKKRSRQAKYKETLRQKLANDENLHENRHFWRTKRKIQRSRDGQLCPAWPHLQCLCPIGLCREK